MFNIFSKLAEEIEDFDNGTIPVVDNNVDANSVKFLRKKSTNYDFSTKKTINKIDLYYNSLFETGKIDREGQTKVFLNINKFKCDVATKMIDIDRKDFIFVPENSSSKWKTLFINKKFSIWSRKEGFSEILNEFGLSLPKYGTIVSKVVNNEIYNVPLHTLRVQQDAKCLEEARYVIEEHKLKRYEVARLAEENGLVIDDIDIDKHNYNDDISLFERYGVSDVATIKKFNGETPKEGDYDTFVKTMSILTLNEVGKAKKAIKEASGTILFISEIKDDEMPYDECHWRKIDGRWLGEGEVENQFENQMSINVLANLRRRALLWASKRIYQSASDDIQRNLLSDVADGTILSTMQPISPINTQTQALGDFASDDKVWNDNSNQKSFTFEVATGEALPSGTPFRLGAVLSNAVSSHFNGKRENFGLFLKRIVYNKIIPQLRKYEKSKTLSFFLDEDGVQELYDITVECEVNKEIKRQVLEMGIYPDKDAIRANIEAEIKKRGMLEYTNSPEIYEDAEMYIDIVVTGEDVDIKSKIETLTNLLQLSAGNPAILQDPILRSLISKAVSYTGENLDSIIPKGQGSTQAQLPPAISNQMKAIENSVSQNNASNQIIA